MRRFLQRIMILAAMALILYSPVANWYVSQKQQDLIGNFAETAQQLDSSLIEDELEKARLYNQKTYDLLCGGIYEEKEEYQNLNYSEIMDFGAGMMATLRIPCIDVALPVYHGTDESVLSFAIGHHPQTAFPIGTTGSRPVLTGHSGMATSKIFTRLDELEIGDVFFIDIPRDDRLAYEVFDIDVRLPEDAQVTDLLPVEGEDWVTMMTCTPYGVNTHRLLITGRRIELSEEEIDDVLDTHRTGYSWHELLIRLLPYLMLIACILLFARNYWIRKRSKKG